MIVNCYTKREQKIHYIYICIYKKHLKRPPKHLASKEHDEMKDELESLVAQRKQTSSSGNQIVFQTWHIKGKPGSGRGVENVTSSHREFWYKPNSLQTNRSHVCGYLKYRPLPTV